MSYTFTEHRTDGIATTFPFQFAGKDKAYLRASDIVVFMKLEGSWLEVSGWALSGTNQITFITPPAASTEINLRIRRIVPKVNPYAEFARGVTLDMRSLNFAFIQNLQVSQELMDGFFPDGFFYKEDLNMGGNRILNLADGVDTTDAVNLGQLKAVDDKHTQWNQEQDIILEGLKVAAGSSTSNRTVPWVYKAKGGELVLSPPYIFTNALVYINGVLQYELMGAISIANNKITFAEKLTTGDDILVLAGSRTAAPEDTEAEFAVTVTEGQTTVNLGVPVTSAVVYLDGLKQPQTAYSIQGTKLVFTEELPGCNLTALATIQSGGA